MNAFSVAPAVSGQSNRIAIILTIAAGFIARLAVFAILPNQHFPDAGVYAETGRALMTTGFMSSPIYMPLYPIWTWIWGGAWGVKFGDVVLSTAMIWLVWRLANIITEDHLAAFVAALISAFYPYFLFYAVSGLSETLFTFLLLAAFLCLYRKWFAAGSAFLVLTILVRPAVDLVAPILVGLFALAIHRASVRQAALRIAQYACIYLALMTPWWVHNYERYGEFVRLDLGAGGALYAGNNPLNSSGGGVARKGSDTDVDWTQFQLIKDPVKWNATLEHAAWSYIEEHPVHFLHMAGVKFVRFWRLWPYAEEYDKPWTVVVSLLSYGVLLGCAIVYLSKSGQKNFRVLSPIVLLTLYLTLVHMATVGSIRYRFPLEPFVIMLGSAELAAIARVVSRSMLPTAHS